MPELDTAQPRHLPTPQRTTTPDAPYLAAILHELKAMRELLEKLVMLARPEPAPAPVAEPARPAKARKAKGA